MHVAVVPTGIFGVQGTEGVCMATGLVLIMFGAFLAFAVEDHVDNVNLGVTGWILIFGGLVSITYSRYTSASSVAVNGSSSSSRCRATRFSGARSSPSRAARSST